VTWEGGDNRNVLVPASPSAGIKAEFDKLGQQVSYVYMYVSYILMYIYITS
jgi:hypothetical protein